MSNFLHSTEVGDPLEMISYGIIILTLVREICEANPEGA